jgi:hypothetical protein
LILVQVAYQLDVKPFIDSENSKLQLFNESCLLITSYIFLTHGKMSTEGIYLEDNGPQSEDGFKLQIGDPELEYMFGIII